MQREYHKWWSRNLDREMELLVFGHAGAPVLVFPTRGGRFYEYEQLRMTERLRPKVEAGHLQLYCVDSIDAESFYCWWAHPEGRIHRHIQFEKYLLHEVLPFIDEKNPNPNLIAHGCSMGAFHAANLVFRHPHRFVKLAAFSGRYDLTLPVEHFHNLFDGHYNPDIYFHTPTHFLPNLECDQLLGALRRIDMIFVIGLEDPFLENNRELSRILAAKQIPHQLFEWDGRAHSGYAWRRMASIYI